MRRATVAAVLAIVSLVAAAPPDSAVIVNSGSTNSAGYKIVLSSNGKATVTAQSHSGTPSGAVKSFTVANATATRFFADLAAARSAKLATVPCMKSASFGTSTRVTWQGWVSSDLECPANGPVGEALVKDLEAIRQAAGIGSAVHQP